MPIVTVTILEKNFDVEYDYVVTSHGSPATFDDPAEGAEFELTLLGISVPKQAADVTLEVPAWLESVILEHLYERDDVNLAVQTADQEHGDGPDDDRE